jgi:hypothetical protein
LAHSKGGWWAAALAHSTEHDLRIARAILGSALDGVTGDTARNAVLYGPLDDAVYGALAALAASLFVRMAQSCVAGRLARMAATDSP